MMSQKANPFHKLTKKPCSILRLQSVTSISRLQKSRSYCDQPFLFIPVNMCIAYILSGWISNKQLLFGKDCSLPGLGFLSILLSLIVVSTQEKKKKGFKVNLADNESYRLNKLPCHAKNANI